MIFAGKRHSVEFFDQPVAAVQGLH